MANEYTDSISPGYSLGATGLPSTLASCRNVNIPMMFVEIPTLGQQHRTHLSITVKLRRYITPECYGVSPHVCALYGVYWVKRSEVSKRIILICLIICIITFIIELYCRILQTDVYRESCKLQINIHNIKIKICSFRLLS